MSELVNSFSWSHSAAGDFEDCRRKRYWSKYAMWNGWRLDAPPESRKAYRLNKMQNRHSLKGQAVERAIRWVLDQSREGRDVSAEQAYQEVARPFLNQAWKESREGQWREDPKRFCCLHEQYYPELQRKPPEEWTPVIIENIKLCIQHFIEQVLPRLREVLPEREVPIHTVEAGGDPESFAFEGVKIYAIPDYVYTLGADWHIHDWKSGQPSKRHVEQVALYGLWAKVKHGVPAERVQVHLEYLLPGTVESFTLDEAALEQVIERLSVSVGEMSEYLVDGDRERNEPLPKEEWELATDRRLCTRCNFFELCRPELEE